MHHKLCWFMLKITAFAFSVVCLLRILASRTGIERVKIRAISTIFDALAGDLSFNPEKDTLVGADGKEVLLKSPFGDELPEKGFDRGVETYQAPNPGGDFSVEVSPDSNRLQLLTPFKAWDGKDLEVTPLSLWPHLDSCLTVG